jgi:hypothetical protein
MSWVKKVFLIGLLLFFVSAIYISINGIEWYGGIFIGILGVFLVGCSIFFKMMGFGQSN